MVGGGIAELIEEVGEREDVAGFAITRNQGKRIEEREATRNEGRGVSRGSERTMTSTPQPAYQFESKIADVEAPQHVLQRILDVEVPNLKVRDLLALSGDLRKQMVENTRTQKSPLVNAALTSMPSTPLEFATPLREVEVVIMRRQREMGLLDEGSEIVIIREDLCKELGLEVNRERKMIMQTANGGKEEMLGCIEYLELEVGGVMTYAHAFVVEKAPFRLLLGRPWQKGVKLGKIEKGDGRMEVEVTLVTLKRRTSIEFATTTSNLVIWSWC